MKNMIIVGLLALLGSTSALAETAIKFVNNWKWEGPAAPLLLALDTGLYEKAGLVVQMDSGTGSLDAIPRVASGVYQMGSADINSLIKFRDKNPDLPIKAIFVIYNAPPFAIIGRKSQGVSSPKDLEGKTLGAPAPDGAYAQWGAFVKVNDIDAATVEIENIGFPVREPMLAQGKIDAITGFSYSSYIDLKANGVPEDDITLMLMSDYGLELYGDVIMVNPAFAEENPDAVKAFLAATVEGYRETVADPVAAIKHVLNHSDVAHEEVELERLEIALAQNIVTDEVMTNGIGGVVMDRLTRSIEQLGDTFKFDTVPKAEDIFDTSFLSAAAERMLK